MRVLGERKRGHMSISVIQNPSPIDNHCGDKQLLRVSFMPSTERLQKTDTVTSLEVSWLIILCQGFYFIFKFIYFTHKLCHPSSPIICIYIMASKLGLLWVLECQKKRISVSTSTFVPFLELFSISFFVLFQCINVVFILLSYIIIILQKLLCIPMRDRKSTELDVCVCQRNYTK